MDVAVNIVLTYLQLNGYFVRTEVPVVERVQENPARFQQITDIDVLAVRFPPQERRRLPREDEHWAGVTRLDPNLHARNDEVDVIIGEVKEGESRLNPNLTRAPVLRAALLSCGCAPEQTARVARRLLARGETRIEGPVGPVRYRLVAFGGSESGDKKSNYRVIPLRELLEFLGQTIEDNHEVFKVIAAHDPVLDLVLLMSKLGLGKT